MKKGQQISLCPGCRHVVNFSKIGFSSRPIPDTGFNNVVEIGIKCPHCDYWQHSYYLNDDLVALQDDLATGKQQRQYKHKFRKLQQVLRKKFLDGDSRISRQNQRVA